ncbi:MarR family EPS-associated transcriptional regulator [Candidatus Methylopumilus planktonicus]|uniref:MarR family EPS-associated transcriptional regulator n=1 Tax=Candidatus Methylopumilus planktonicus TaxID=1581557 RepID=UPI0011233111|nr:MarR family EPS-associated transcriptional regulator [Candidatus Methylopumilus planktonicus]QDD01809.1 MarR family EPS-associated transcriptional regulator [Candidatus Methylopumilus planktonicus]
MAQTFKVIDPDIHFRALNVLEKKPDITQRQLAKILGISLGSVNYCLRALIDVGHIKVNNFQKNPNKSGYLYLLTPKGISKKTVLASEFLKRKMEEYEALRIEIENIQHNSK